jgi:hypothetical protein
MAAVRCHEFPRLRREGRSAVLEQRRAADAASEQQSPGHSPIEEEFVSSRTGAAVEREGLTIVGLGASVALVAVFATFLIGAVVILFVT